MTNEIMFVARFYLPWDQLPHETHLREANELATLIREELQVTWLSQEKYSARLTSCGFPGQTDWRRGERAPAENHWRGRTLVAQVASVLGPDSGRGKGPGRVCAGPARQRLHLPQVAPSKLRGYLDLMI